MTKVCTFSSLRPTHPRIPVCIFTVQLAGGAVLSLTQKGGNAARALVITAHAVPEARRELVLSPALSPVEELSRTVLARWVGVLAETLLD